MHEYYLTLLRRRDYLQNFVQSLGVPLTCIGMNYFFQSLGLPSNCFGRNYLEKLFLLDISALPWGQESYIRNLADLVEYKTKLRSFFENIFRNFNELPKSLYLSNIDGSDKILIELNKNLFNGHISNILGLLEILSYHMSGRREISSSQFNKFVRPILTAFFRCQRKRVHLNNVRNNTKDCKIIGKRRMLYRIELIGSTFGWWETEWISKNDKTTKIGDKKAMGKILVKFNRDYLAEFRRQCRIEWLRTARCLRLAKDIRLMIAKML